MSDSRALAKAETTALSNQRENQESAPALMKQTEELSIARDRFIQANRVSAVRMTVPSDWIDHGDGKLYLQSCGANRANQIFRISIVNIQPPKEIKLNFHGRDVTIWEFRGTAVLPEVRLPNGTVLIESTSADVIATYDPNDNNKFMQRPGDLWKKAETQLLRQAVVKLGGLEGFSRQDMEAIFGTTIQQIERQSGSKGGQAKRELSSSAKDLRTRIGNALIELAKIQPACTEDNREPGDVASEMLEELTTFVGSDGKTIKGRRSCRDLSEKQIPVTWKKLCEGFGSALVSLGVIDESELSERG